MLDPLFTPGRIGSLSLKNRIVMTPLHMGFPLEQEIGFLRERARGGAASVTAVLGVAPGGCSRTMEYLRPELLPQLSRLAEICARYDCKSFVQLFHVGRNARSGELADPQAFPMAPSAVPSPIYKSMPEPLTDAQIVDVVGQFAWGAALCRAAGIDGVEISCSAGYLLNLFLSPHTNLRQDRYGGAVENRMRFPLEVTQAVRREVGPVYPVIMRLSGDSMVEGGYTLADMKLFAAAAAPYLDAFSVTGGWHESPVPQISSEVAPGAFAYLAEEIGEAAGLPTVACNRIGTAEAAREVLGRGKIPFVGCARAFIVEPQFANKLREGQSYAQCVACNRCVRAVLKNKVATCPLNPQLGLENTPTANRAHSLP